MTYFMPLHNRMRARAAEENAVVTGLPTPQSSAPSTHGQHAVGDKDPAGPKWKRTGRTVAPFTATGGAGRQANNSSFFFSFFSV